LLFFYYYLLHHPFAIIILSSFILSDCESSFCFGALIYLFFFRIGILFIYFGLSVNFFLFSCGPCPRNQISMPPPITKNCIPKCRPFGTRPVSFCPIHMLDHLYPFWWSFPYDTIELKDTIPSVRSVRGTYCPCSSSQPSMSLLLSSGSFLYDAFESLSIIIFFLLLFYQDHLPLGEIKKLLKITNIPLAPLLARDFA
jgi:hypothetical protein